MVTTVQVGKLIGVTMSVKKKTVGKSKSNKIIFDAYQKAINKRMKAGHDASRMVDRLNTLVTEMKK